MFSKSLFKNHDHLCDVSRAQGLCLPHLPPVSWRKFQETLTLSGEQDFGFFPARLGMLFNNFLMKPSGSWAESCFSSTWLASDSLYVLYLYGGTLLMLFLPFDLVECTSVISRDLVQATHYCGPRDARRSSCWILYVLAIDHPQCYTQRGDLHLLS